MNINNSSEGIRQQIKDRLFIGIDPKKSVVGNEQSLEIVNGILEDMKDKETEVDLEIEERLMSLEKVDKDGDFQQAYDMICEIDNFLVRIDMKKAFNVKLIEYDDILADEGF